MNQDFKTGSYLHDLLYSMGVYSLHCAVYSLAKLETFYCDSHKLTDAQASKYIDKLKVEHSFEITFEDELTMREFEGPNVDEVTWSKKVRLKMM